jgi:hypothetical protein
MRIGTRYTATNPSSRWEARLSVTDEELRPPRTTANLGLPIPGDVGPADYVTATGDLADAVDDAVHARDPSTTVAFAELYSITWAVAINPQMRIPLTPTPRSQVSPVPGHAWRDANGDLLVPVPGIWLVTTRLVWTAESATGGRWLVVLMPLNVPNIPVRQASQNGSAGNVQMLTSIGPLKPGQPTSFQVIQNSAANLNATISYVSACLLVPLSTGVVDTLQSQYPADALILPSREWPVDDEKEVEP